MTAFETHLRKKFEDTDADVDYYLETIRKFPEGEWIATTSRDGSNDHSIFAELYHERHMVAVNIQPIWVNGSYRSQRLLFMYKEDMNYADT